MESNILKSIICNTDLHLDAESSSQWQAVKSCDDFPVTKTAIINGLSKRFTKLLSFKVPKEIHQRYSVRLCILETLRDWSHVKGDIGNILAFQNAEESYNFLAHLLQKYLKEENLNTCNDIDQLVQAAEVLLNAFSKNKIFKKNFGRLVERIINLQQNKKSEQFLEHIIQESEILKLDSCLLDKIYETQKLQFINKPLTDYFIAYCSDQNIKVNSESLEILFDKIVGSPTLFKLVVNQLKDYFVETDYSKLSQDYIQIILDKIRSHCNKYKKNILDLYSTNVQHCVILLQIKPIHHSTKSINYTVQSLKEIFLVSNDDALILVSHFPDWLPNYLDFFDCPEAFTQNSEIKSTESL